jgi:hypothetical protein
MNDDDVIVTELVFREVLDDLFDKPVVLSDLRFERLEDDQIADWRIILEEFWTGLTGAFEDDALTLRQIAIVDPVPDFFPERGMGEHLY